MLNSQKGFLLISIIFIMLMMAVSIFSINYYSVTQIRMSSNHTDSIQTGYDLKAIVEESLWELTKNPFWRTNVAGEDTIYNGTTYERKALNANDDGLFEGTAPPALDDYEDAVTIQVTPKGSDQPFQRSFRYYAFELSGLSVNDPERISMTPSGNLLIADRDHHKIIHVNPDTSAITVIAGTGSAGEDLPPGPGDRWYYGSNRPRLDTPRAAIYDPSDNSFYIADTKNHRIVWGYYYGFGWWRFYEWVGTGHPGFSGDGGESWDAELNEPRDVVRDTALNLYIADTKNHRIRKVDVTENVDIITTIAGKAGPPGSSGDGGPATNAQLHEPQGICLDSIGNLYIADTRNNKIRKVNLSTGIISTVAGIGGPSGSSGDGGAATSAKLNEPKDVFVDESGNIFIADEKNNKIRVVAFDEDNPTDSKIYTLAGTGVSGDTADRPAAEAKLNDPSGITMASSYGGSRIFISDRNSNKIKFLLLKPVYGL
jgi:NHL repeat